MISDISKVKSANTLLSRQLSAAISDNRGRGFPGNGLSLQAFPFVGSKNYRTKNIETTASLFLNPEIRDQLKYDVFDITQLDLLITDVVASLWMTDKKTITIDDILLALTGSDSHDAPIFAEYIRYRIEETRHIVVEIDWTEECRRRYPEEAPKKGKCIIRGPFHQLSERKWILNHRERETEVYEILGMPPLNEYADAVNQIVEISVEQIPPSGKMSVEKLLIRYHLLKKVMIMLNPKNRNKDFLRKVPLFTTKNGSLGVFEEADIFQEDHRNWKVKKGRTVKICKDIFEELCKEELIGGYEPIYGKSDSDKRKKEVIGFSIMLPDSCIA